MYCYFSCDRQPSDSYAFDGGGAVEEDLGLMFAPAAPAVVKRAKGNKVVLGKDKNASSKAGNTTPKSKTSRKNFEDVDMASPSSNKSTPTKAPPSSSLPGTPPLPSSKRKKEISGGIQDEEDVDYKEWWMQCFPDAFKNLMPTR